MCLGAAVGACGDDRRGSIDATIAAEVDAAVADAAEVDAPTDAATDATVADAAEVDASIDATATDAAIDGVTIDGAPADAAPASDLSQLDPGFAGQGYRDLMNATGVAVAVQPDQKLVICAAGSLGSALFRLLPNGDLDPAFAGGAPIPAGSSGCYDVAILTDGRIAVAAFPGGADSLVSADGATVTPLVRPTAAPGTGLITNHFLPAADGGFFIAMDQGRNVPPLSITKTSAIARYAVDGTLVPTFGQGGLAVLPYDATNLFGVDDRTTQVARVTVAGVDHLVVATARENVVAVNPTTGAIDGTFATTYGINQDPVALATGADGHAILAIGIPFGVNMARTTVLAIAATGQLSGQVSTTYCATTPERGAIAGLSVDASGRPIVVLRESRDHVTTQLARTTAEVMGLDPTWGCGRSFRLPTLCLPTGACEQVTTKATDSALAADGSVVVVGYRWRLGTAARAFVARVRAEP